MECRASSFGMTAAEPARANAMLSTTIGSNATSFIPVSSRNAMRAPNGTARERSILLSRTGVSRGERGAKNCRRRSRKIEQHPARDGDERRGDERSRTEQPPRELSSRADLSRLDGYRIAEEH